MQTLFAFDQCKDANYSLALDQLEERFSPENMVASYVAAYEATIAAFSNA